MSTVNKKKKKKYDDSYAFAQTLLRFIIIILIILVVLAAYLIFKRNAEKNIEIEIEGTDPLFTDTGTNGETLPPISFEPQTKAPKVKIQENELHGGFEIPIDGATGYVGMTINAYTLPDLNSAVVMSLASGDYFTILADMDGWLQIKSGTVTGWLQSKYCFVNLPDVIPSIIYNNTNASKSIYKSSGYIIPGLTGEKLYDAFAYNQRLGKDEFIMLILYGTAKKICTIQQTALKLGYTLVMYETYRPYEAQQTIYKSLTSLMKKNATVRAGISTDVWSTTWFAASSVSAHQQGYAFDANLAQISACTTVKIGKYTVTCPSETVSCSMPTEIHELSVKAVTFEYPFSSLKKTGWESVPLAETMTDDAKVLRYLCTTGNLLVPLASEWWHFNDLDARSDTSANAGDGMFIPSVCVSSLPD